MCVHVNTSIRHQCHEVQYYIYHTAVLRLTETCMLFMVVLVLIEIMHMRAYFSYGVLSHHVYATVAMNCRTMCVYNTETDRLFLLFIMSVRVLIKSCICALYLSYGILRSTAIQCLYSTGKARRAGSRASSRQQWTMSKSRH